MTSNLTAIPDTGSFWVRPCWTNPLYRYAWRIVEIKKFVPDAEFIGPGIILQNVITGAKIDHPLRGIGAWPGSERVQWEPAPEVNEKEYTMSERFELFGTIAQERDDNTGINKSNQKVEDGPVVYRTDDHDEAEAIRLAGGFVKDDQWVVVTGYRDTTKNEAPAAPKDPVPSKDEF